MSATWKCEGELRVKSVDSSDEIEREAIVWAVAVDGAELDACRTVELENWLAGDSRRRGAYIRARAALRLLHRAVTEPSGADQTDERGADIVSPHRRLFLSGGVAAAALASAGFYYHLQPHFERSATAVGEARRLPLEDGSVAMLNTASMIETRFTADRRLVQFDRGEGWFRVAHDRTRPFIVRAEFASVRALGTAFAVRLYTDKINLLVTEGIVELAAFERLLTLQAGADVSVAASGKISTSQLTQEAMERRLAWQKGSISLNGEPLWAAAEEFNRYNTVKIVVDPGLSQETVVGWFDYNDPAGFADSVAATFGGVALKEASGIRLSRPAVK
jgi:transmembrane sensor